MHTCLLWAGRNAVPKSYLMDFLIDGQDALIVDPLDTPALAKAILSLLKDKRLHQEISSKGHDKAHATFTWEHIAESTLEILVN